MRAKYRLFVPVLAAEAGQGQLGEPPCPCCTASHICQRSCRCLLQEEHSEHRARLHRKHKRTRAALPDMGIPAPQMCMEALPWQAAPVHRDLLKS